MRSTAISPKTIAPKTIEAIVYVVIWGGLVCAWNLGYPGAKPWMDIVASVAILLITRFSLRWAHCRAGTSGS